MAIFARVPNDYSAIDRSIPAPQFKPSDDIGDRPVVLGAAADRGHSRRYCRPTRAPGRSNGSMAAVALASLSQFSA